MRVYCVITDRESAGAFSSTDFTSNGGCSVFIEGLRATQPIKRCIERKSNKAFRILVFIRLILKKKPFCTGHIKYFRAFFYE